MVFAFFAPPHARPEESQSHSGDPCVFNTILPTFSPGESAQDPWADSPMLKVSEIMLKMHESPECDCHSSGLAWGVNKKLGFSIFF